MPPYLKSTNEIVRPVSTATTTRQRQQQQTTNNANNADADEWRTIYRLPLIRLASAFNRVKIPYGVFNAISIPVAFALEQASQLPASTATLVGAVGLTSWMTLSICSLLTKNLVGIIYINDNNDKMKLAYIDFWGNRNDVVIDLDDLMPESEKKRPSKFDFYQTLTLCSNDQVKYKLLQRFGQVEDPETFVAIFGE
ncbi:transmembrane protein 186 [Musca vetustissima]|uniref:transmembrane protein 186 n=1 Tax=Musca vetustissima TaxID=27455 RepID=UPI002AB60136|nr:transmembrane protein 186 [Musca vetustissima]